MFFEKLKEFDSEVYASCERELKRQQHNIELIASENIVSEGVLLAAGSVLTNKYAEGYPGKSLQESVPKSCSEPSMPTFSLTAAPMLILRCFMLF